MGQYMIAEHDRVNEATRANSNMNKVIITKLEAQLRFVEHQLNVFVHKGENITELVN